MWGGGGGGSNIACIKIWIQRFDAITLYVVH